MLNCIERKFSLFVLETNGILFDAEPGYVRALAEFKKPHMRGSLKAVGRRPSLRRRELGLRALRFPSKRSETY